MRKCFLTSLFRLCLVGISQTPGCVSLLPASLFSNFNPGTNLFSFWVSHIFKLKTLFICFPFIELKLLFSSDQPGMLCSFKISTAWSCAWCLNPQADKSFSTGEILYAFLQYAVGKKIMLTVATFI